MTQKTQVDLILKRGELLTMDAERRILTDGAIAVSGNVIVAVGKTEEVIARYEGQETWDLEGALVRPGFIDAHVHVSFQLNRGLIRDDSGYDQAWEELWVPFLQALTPEEEYLGTLLACIEMVRNGTTTFCEGMSNLDVPAVKRAADQTGMRALLGEWLWDLPDEPDRLVRDTQSCLDALQAQIDTYGLFSTGRVGVAVSLFAAGSASDQLLQGAKELADRHGVMLYIHQSYSKEEIAAYMELIGGQRPLQHLAELDILDPKTVLVHASQLTREEFDIFLTSGCMAVHCPAASLKYGLGASRVGWFPEMVKEGCIVALGSDSANWSNVFDVGFQAYLAATIHREARMAYPLITAEQALEMATLNGARILQQDGRIGALAPGHKADIVIVRRKRAEWYPMLDLVYDLVYAGRSQDVDTVIIDGEVVLRDGQFTRFDERAALAEIHRAALALAKRVGCAPTARWPVVA